MGMAEGEPQALVAVAFADYGTMSRRQGQPAYPAFGLKPFG